MFSFNIDYRIARAAKFQHYSLLKKFKDNNKTGFLIYRGYFGNKHNFAYAQLSTMDRTSDAYKHLVANHNNVARYYN